MTRTVLVLVLVLVLGLSSTHARDGVKQATKSPPPVGAIPVEKTIAADPTPAAGNVEGGPRALAWSADKRLLAVGNHDGAVSVLDVTQETPKWRRLAQHGGAVAGIAFLARGERTFVVSAADDGTVLAADIDVANVSSRALGLGALTALALLDAGPATPRLACGTSRGSLALVNFDSEPTLEGTIELSGTPLVSGIARLTRDKVAIAGWDGQVRLVDLAKKKELKGAKVAPVELTGIAASGDAKTLIVSSWKKGVVALDASSLKTLSTYEPHRQGAQAVACAEARARVVTASIGDETVCASEPWEKTWSPVLRTKVPGVASAIALSSDGLLLACGTYDGTVLIYKLPEVPRG